uniref:Uncharacterized protein n=1 Tax=Anguilla anguilla TaxID=7936 RepID=A0A0E9W657_ANGAN
MMVPVSKLSRIKKDKTFTMPPSLQTRRPSKLLTYAQTSNQLRSVFGHRAHREYGLQQVSGEDICHDILRGGSDDEQFDPQFQESR